ncbi:MAG: alpha/beta fold hydrolase [Bradymonadaceae bacterium]|nr:alpha/beta fold hydrolase [Lujinxingiaceae bacterium]
MGEVLNCEHAGCTLSYRVEGDGAPVLFIQGVGLHGDGWRPQVEGLCARYRCLSFDNRGMGLSQPVGGRLTIEQMADDVGALLDAQGWESAHVVGHSMGGFIALQLALAHPKRVRSLVLMCTASSGRDTTRVSWPMVSIGLRAQIGSRRMRRNAFLEFVMPPAALKAADRDALASELAVLFGHDLGVQPPVAMKQVAAMRAYDATPRLSALSTIPTLVISAEHDVIAPPRFGRAMAAALGGARFIEIADAAHGVPIHQAEQINALLHEHFATVV